MQQLVRYYEPAWSEFITWQRCANLVRSESFLRMRVIILLTLMRCWEEWSVLTIIWLNLSRVLWPTQSCWLFIKYLIVTATILNSSNPENISRCRHNTGAWAQILSKICEPGGGEDNFQHFWFLWHWTQHWSRSLSYLLELEICLKSHQSGRLWTV